MGSGIIITSCTSRPWLFAKSVEPAQPLNQRNRFMVSIMQTIKALGSWKIAMMYDLPSKIMYSSIMFVNFAAVII